ncbi:MAG: hypothetical protein NVSMB65_09410 [Chloroflexota bacterium]
MRVATILDRLRDGLIWSYAALSLVEERQERGQVWWQQENIRLKEEARARLDNVLQQWEERRNQRADMLQQRAGWVKERVRTGLSDSGLATTAQIDSLQARIDALAAQLEGLQAREATPRDAAYGAPSIVPPSASQSLSETVIAERGAAANPTTPS